MRRGTRTTDVTATRSRPTERMKKPQHCWGQQVAAHSRNYLDWRGQDSNLRPRGYEPRELPGCSTPRQFVERAVWVTVRTSLLADDAHFGKVRLSVSLYWQTNAAKRQAGKPDQR
jgi:hypothetical protein